jgi:predicted secreted hydrolase
MLLYRALFLTVGMASILLYSLALAQNAPHQFKQALPGYTFSFPRDHAAHNGYKTEWWYYTGHLQTSKGQRYGYELTFFRTAHASENQPLGSQWTLTQIYPAHFAVSDETHQRFFFTEKLNRAGIGVAGAREDIYSVWNETWTAELLGNQHVLKAESPEFSIHLLQTPEKPPILHGQNGVSQKADCVGCASHYYSMTRLKTDGVLYLNGKAIPVTGISWMDHEFGSNQLGKTQVGWDWFSLQLDNRTELMLYVLRNEDGSVDPNSSGTWVLPNGQSRHLSLQDFQITPLGQWTSPKSTGTYPMGWRITVPSEGLDLTVKAAFENQELITGRSTEVTYWEGSSHVSGSAQGKPITGQAYVEMTGYAEPFRQGI